MKMSVRVLLLVYVMFSAAMLSEICLPARADVVIAENGQPVASIVIASDATESEQAASNELLSWLKEMTGAEFEIVRSAELPVPGAVNIGLRRRFRETKVSLPEQKVFIECDGKTLIIAGGGERGMIYSVIEFLRHLGCRQPLPRERVAPKRKTLRVGALDIEKQPAVKCRLFWVSGDWWGRNVSTGRNSFKFSRGHAMPRLVPSKPYFSEHPEWFALVNGKREPHQLCYSNPDVLDQFVTGIEELCKTKKYDAIGLSPKDGRGFCECEECGALGERLSDRMVWFQNQAIERLEDKYPEQAYFTFIYTPYDDPPVKVRPHPKLHLMYCPFVKHQDHPYGPTGSVSNVKAFRILEAVAKLAPGRVMIYEYGPYDRCCPRPNLFKVAADFKTFQRCGVMYFYRDMGRINLWTQGINMYADGRLCWDPQLSSEEIIHDFCSMFGPAQKVCEEYFDVQERSMASARNIGYVLNEDLPKVYTPEVLAKCRALMNRAIEEAEGDAQAARRVELLNRGFTYVEKRLDQIRSYRAWQKDPTEENRKRALAVSEDLLNYLKRLGGIIDVKGGRQFCEEIRDSLTSTIHGIGPGKFSYHDRYDEGNTRIGVDAAKRHGCFVTGPLLAQEPGKMGMVEYEITAKDGHTFKSLRFRVWQLGFPGAPNMKIDLLTANGKQHTLYDGARQQKWHAYDVAEQVAGSSACRLRITRDNPTGEVQEFLGALRVEGEVE